MLVQYSNVRLLKILKNILFPFGRKFSVISIFFLTFCITLRKNLCRKSKGFMQKIEKIWNKQIQNFISVKILLPFIILLFFMSKFIVLKKPQLFLMQLWF